AGEAPSKACEGLFQTPLVCYPPLPWNDLVQSPFRYARVAWRYTPCIRRCVGRSRLSACVQILSSPFSPILLFFALHGRCVGPATEAISECIRRCCVWETESTIELLDPVPTPAGGQWDASFTVKRMNFEENPAKASRGKCELDQMREVAFVPKADVLAVATNHLALILLRFACHRRTSREGAAYAT